MSKKLIEKHIYDIELKKDFSLEIGTQFALYNVKQQMLVKKK